MLQVFFISLQIILPVAPPYIFPSSHHALWLPLSLSLSHRFIITFLLFFSAMHHWSLFLHSLFIIHYVLSSLYSCHLFFPTSPLFFIIFSFTNSPFSHSPVLLQHIPTHTPTFLTLFSSIYFIALRGPHRCLITIFSLPCSTLITFYYLF